MRLIDADKLILYLNDYALQEAPFRGERAEAYNATKQCIELDVKAIKRYKGGTFGNYEGTDYYIEKSKAIEIVKQGGISDDVCEWTLDGVYLHSPHKPLVSCVTDENYRYYYCPVCGKKIKVVE